MNTNRDFQNTLLDIDLRQVSGALVYNPKWEAIQKPGMIMFVSSGDVKRGKYMLGGGGIAISEKGNMSFLMGDKFYGIADGSKSLLFVLPIIQVEEERESDSIFKRDVLDQVAAGTAKVLELLGQAFPSGVVRTGPRKIPSSASAGEDSANPTWTLQAELAIKPETLRRTPSIMIYGEGPAEEERMRKNDEIFNNLGPQRIEGDLLINGTKVARLRFGSYEEDAMNRDLGEHSPDCKGELKTGHVWVTKSPLLDITPDLKKPGYIFGASNELELAHLDISNDTFSPRLLKMMFRQQQEDDAKALARGEKDPKYSTEFIKVFIFRNGNLAKEHSVLFRVKNVTDGTNEAAGFQYSAELLGSVFDLEIAK